ncbi:MAG: hypothetical protein IPN36_12480 [Bacteroidetes bacterium]|nr:hypothetical protein [Bacteroidota bacterium]
MVNSDVLWVIFSLRCWGTLAAGSFSGTLKGFNIANPGCNPGLAAQHPSPTPTGLNIEDYKSYYSLILHNESYLTNIELTSYHPRTRGECLVITRDAEITSPAFAERVKTMTQSRIATMKQNPEKRYLKP